MPNLDSATLGDLGSVLPDLAAEAKTRALEFEKAALLRDQIVELKRTLAVEEPEQIVPRAFLRVR